MTPEEIARDEQQHKELLRRSEAAGKQSNGRHTPLSHGYPLHKWGRGLFPEGSEYLDDARAAQRDRGERSARAAEDPENLSTPPRAIADRLSQAEALLQTDDIYRHLDRRKRRQ